MLIRSIFKFFRNNNTVKQSDLGRWRPEKCDKMTSLKILMANMDHCGDKICGKPKKMKIMADEIVKKY